MFNLLRVELLKIRRRPRTWIMAGLMIVALFFQAALISHIDPPDGPDWKQGLIQQNQKLQEEVGPNSHMPEVKKKELASEIQVNQYYIDHDIPPHQKNSWKFAVSATDLMTLTSIFLVILSGDIVSSEFGWGTIKLLLIRPVNRTKILFGKYASLLIVSVLFTVLHFVAAFVIGGLIFGFGGADQPYIYTSPDPAAGLQQTTVMHHAFQIYLCDWVEMLVYMTIAFMISAAFRSSSMAIAISLLLMLVGSQLTLFLFKYSWAKYILMANTDLMQYIEGPRYFEGTSLGFSIAVLVVYMVILHVITWLSFTKRDVAA